MYVSIFSDITRKMREMFFPFSHIGVPVRILLFRTVNSEAGEEASTENESEEDVENADNILTTLIN